MRPFSFESTTLRVRRPVPFLMDALFDFHIQSIISGFLCRMNRDLVCLDNDRHTSKGRDDGFDELRVLCSVLTGAPDGSMSSASYLCLQTTKESLTFPHSCHCHTMAAHTACSCGLFYKLVLLLQVIWSFSHDPSL